MIKIIKSSNILEKIKTYKFLFLMILIVLAVAVYLTIPKGESIYVGIIEATEVDVSARINSEIAERIADEGDIVKKGDILYKLTCENQTVEAEKATNDFKRAQKLLASGNISPEQFDGYKKIYELAKLNVDWCIVRAPINGTVLTKFHESGEYVSAGAKLMKIGDLSDVWAYIYVDQPLLAHLSIGQDVVGFLPELKNKLIAGKIIHIKDEAEFTPKNVQTRKERTRLVYGVKIRFDNSENLLKPGMPIEVRLAKTK